MVIKIPDDYNLELGKSNVEVNIPDGTLEKQHGVLRYDRKIGELVYLDNHSQLGSQLLVQRPIKLAPSKPILLLNGITIMRIEVKKISFKLCDLACLS